MRAIELTGHGNDVVNNYFLNQNAQLSNYYRYLLASIAFGLAAYALIYWLYPVLLKRDLNTRLGVAHFALTLTGLGGVLGRVSVLALSGISRPRLEDEWYGPYGLGRFATVCLGLVAIGQLVFLYNFIRSPLVRREA